MAKIPTHMRAPGPVSAFFGSDRFQRALVAALVVAACWAANEYVVWPNQGPVWASLVLLVIMVLHCARIYVELRDGLDHLGDLRNVQGQLRQLEMLARDAETRGDDDLLAKCAGRAQHLLQREHFHRLGLRGELPPDEDVP